MICSNCPFATYVEPIDENDETYYCEIEEVYYAADNECFFPETIKEKGV